MKSILVLIDGRFARVTRRDCNWLARTPARAIQTEWMRTVRALMLAGFSIVLLIGCELRVPDVSKPSVVVVHADDYFAALADVCADDIKSGLPPTQQELAELIKRLMDHGKLTQADATKFDAAFPGAVTSQQKLTTADVDKLRGLK